MNFIKHSGISSAAGKLPKSKLPRYSPFESMRCK